MKFIRFSTEKDDVIRLGVIENNDVLREIEGNIFVDWSFTDEVFQLDQVKLHAPFQPRHIIGIGLNFVAKGEEKPPLTEVPILFYKPLTTVIGPHESIIIPDESEEVKFESELAVIIGKETKKINPEEVDEHIFGYTIANDVADLKYFHPDGHWAIGKSFDTFCPIGPVIETELDLSKVRVKAYVNGELKQNSGLDLMIMPIDEMISYISHFMTLLPGDIILTGTPDGAGFLRNDDVIECVIDEIGILQNTVKYN